MKKVIITSILLLFVQAGLAQTKERSRQKSVLMYSLLKEKTIRTVKKKYKSRYKAPRIKIIPNSYRKKDNLEIWNWSHYIQDGLGKRTYQLFEYSENKKTGKSIPAKRIK